MLGSFLEVTGTILTVNPNPVRITQPAAFSVTVSGSLTPPADGQVVVDASTGESCSTGGPGQINGMVATFGCSITFATPGPRSISARFSNSATHLDSESPSENLQIMRFADLSVTASDGLSGVNPGDTLSYLVEVRSAGPDSAPGTAVATMIDPALTGTQWTCLAINGAMCPAENGSGMLAEKVSLPAGGGLDYLVEGQLGASPPPSVLFTAIVTEDPLDPNYVLDSTDANNVATDVNIVIPIFDSGFE